VKGVGLKLTPLRFYECGKVEELLRINAELIRPVIGPQHTAVFISMSAGDTIMDNLLSDVLSIVMIFCIGCTLWAVFKADRRLR